MAIDYARNEKYALAVKMINDAIKIEPRYVDAYLSMAGMHANMKNYAVSVENFKKAFSLDSIYSHDYLLPYSISLAGMGKFDEALLSVDKFLQSTHLNNVSRQAGEFRKKTFQFALNYQNSHANNNYIFHPVNLGDSINTNQLEYFPSLTIDGKKLIFTKRINGNEQFYESEKMNDSNWTKARPVQGKVIYPGFNEGAQNISQDGQWLIFTGCNFPGGLGSCDLYISYLTKQGWSEPENLGRNVNSEFWESSPSLSPDKQDLYFSSSVPGGAGGKDIWVCHRNKEGSWAPARNLGKTVNTSGDETCPFIHADNQTLYFNSTGHPGYSEKPDLFVSRKQPDGSWSTPVNLGYPINTIDDEGSLIVSSDGRTAFYSSDRSDTKGGLDIYKFDLREDLRPLKTLWIKGKVFDQKTKNGLPSTIELTNINSRQVVNKLQTDEDGNYLTTLPVGSNYAFNVARKGYLFYSQNINLVNQKLDSPFIRDIPLQPIEANAAMVLNNVFFDSKQISLKPESVIELDNVVRMLNENPKIKIQIAGFTDNVGKPADNLKLSSGRANTVVDYLIKKGISPLRLASKGFGETKPIAANITESGKALNRRTELSVISN